MSGKHTNSSPPYGYTKSAEDKHQWIIDPEAAEVVRRIFRLTMDGKGPYQICCIMEEEKIKTPGAYLAEIGQGLHQSHVFENPYHWTSSTVCGMLKKKEYLGHTVNFKSAKNSYKEKRNHYVPESEWVIFENTHEPIIDQELFDNVQRIRAGVKRRPDGWGYVHPLTGLVFCADCGAKLYIHRINNGKDAPIYACGNSTKVPKEAGWRCTGHRISAEKLMSLVAETLKQISQYARTDKAAFTKAVQEALAAKQSDEIKEQKKQLAGEIETLFTKIYEDHALGKLPEKRFAGLAVQYETEQEQLEKQMPELQAAIDCFEDGSDRAARFIELVNRYENFDDMSVTMLNEFVEQLVVHERDRKGCVNTDQQVDVYLNFIGEFEVPQEPVDPAILAAQEEERRKKAEKQERQHQKYLKLKAEGRIDEYNRRAKAKREAGIPPRHKSKTPEEKAAQAEYRKAYKKEDNRRRWARVKAERAAVAAAALITV